jgi:hypothetical protein
MFTLNYVLVARKKEYIPVTVTGFFIGFCILETKSPNGEFRRHTSFPSSSSCKNYMAKLPPFMPS